MDGIRTGKTFITNGPALYLSVAGEEPGATLQVEKGTRIPVHANWSSHHAVQRVEIVFNGKVVARQDFPNGVTTGHIEAEIIADSDGWIGARLGSGTRDSFNHPIWAHTSPVYVRGTETQAEASKTSAKFYDEQIGEGVNWGKTKGRFYNDSQRKEIVDLFKQGQDWYRKLR